MKPFETTFISYRSINSWLNWWFFGFFSEGYPLKVWGILSRSPKNHRGRPKPNPKNDHLMCGILSFVRTSKYDGLPSSWKKKRTFHIEFCVKRIICLTSIKKKHQIPGFSSPGMEDGTRIAWTSMWQKTKGATWSWSSIFPGATKEVTKTHKQRPVGAPGYLMLFFLGVPIFYGLR